MIEKDLNISKQIIRETFDDTRKIKCSVPEEALKLEDGICSGGDLFMTESGEFIDLRFQNDDFTADDLVRLVEFAEALYEKHKKHVSTYVVCTDNVRVLVKECEIKSRADFTIKLAKFAENPAHKILNSIKRKFKHNRCLSSEDIEILKDLPQRCRKEDRSYFLREYFRIISEI